MISKIHHHIQEESHGKKAGKNVGCCSQSVSSDLARRTLRVIRCVVSEYLPD